MKKLCYVATIPAVVHAFLRMHIQMAADDYHVTVVCSEVDKKLLDGIKANFIFLPIERKPSFLRDVLVLFQLYNLFRREHFDIVHSIMPKTGMLAMLASWFAAVPVRIHMFTGQVWATKLGLARVFLKWSDKLIASLATCVLTDSRSQQDFLLQERILRAEKVNVIGAGSICGVDPFKFHPDIGIRQKVRGDLGIDSESVVILYVGRMCREKGVLDLVAAFTEVVKRNPTAVLLLVGSEEDVSYSYIQEICHVDQGRLHYVSFTATPEIYMCASDILCLPSYREGFGMSIIEAAACGLPAVASRIYGITDAVADGETGLLFPAGDVSALTRSLMDLIMRTDRRQKMGGAAYARTLELFSSEKITREMVILYNKLSEESCGTNDNAPT